MISARALINAGVSPGNADKYTIPYNEVLDKYDLTSSLRTCHFTAQVLHESGRFQYMEELASGAAYEGRKDLGNTKLGDGVLYKGRGAIQLTGRFNYIAYGNHVNMDLVRHPELVAKLPLCFDSAAWFFVNKHDWENKSLPELADRNNFIRISYLVNGGFNGLTSRLHYLGILLKAYNPNWKLQMQEIYNYIADCIEAHPESGMRGELYHTVQTKETLTRMFAGLI